MVADPVFDDEEEQQQPQGHEGQGISDVYDDFRDADDMFNKGKIGNKIDQGVQNAKDNIFGKKKSPDSSDDTSDAADNKGSESNKPETEQNSEELNKPGADNAGQDGKGLSQSEADAASNLGDGAEDATGTGKDAAEGLGDTAEAGKDAAEGLGDTAEAGVDAATPALEAATPPATAAAGGVVGTGAGEAAGAAVGGTTGAIAGGTTGAATGGGVGATAGTAVGGAVGLSGLAAGGVGVVVTEPIGLAAGATTGGGIGAAGGGVGGATAGGGIGATTGGATGGVAGGATGTEVGATAGEAADVAAEAAKDTTKLGTKMAEIGKKIGKVADVMDKGNKIIEWIQKYWKCGCCFFLPIIFVIAIAYYASQVFHLDTLSRAGQAILSIFHRNSANGSLNFTDPASLDAIKNGNIGKSVADIFTTVSNNQDVTFNFVGTSPITGKVNQPYEFDVSTYGLIKCSTPSEKLQPIKARVYKNFDWNSVIIPGKETANCTLNYYPGESRTTSAYFGLGPGEFQLGDIVAAGSDIARQQSAEAINAIVKINAQKVADEKDLPLKKLTLSSELYSIISLMIDQSLRSAYPDRNPSEIIKQIPGADGIHFEFD